MIDRLHPAVRAGALALLPLAVLLGPTAASAACGSTATLAEGETLAELAERCDTNVPAILAANPDIGAGTLAAGTELTMPEIPGIIHRAQRAVDQLGRQARDAASSLGSNVSDALANNPDLNQDIVRTGKNLGIPGFESAATRGAEVMVAEAGDGGRVLVHARGLPAQSDVTIGAGPPRAAYEIVAKATTDDAGALSEEVALPDALARRGELVFTVETANGRTVLRSEPYRTASAGADGDGNRRLNVTGTLEQGTECPILRAADGTTYSIPREAMKGFAAGDRVRVEGRRAEMSTCMQGTHIDVSRIEAAG